MRAVPRELPILPRSLCPCDHRFADARRTSWAVAVGLLISTSAWAADWKLVGGDAAFDVYYDAANITKESFPKNGYTGTAAAASFVIVWTRSYNRASGKIFSTSELALDCHGHIGFIQEWITGDNPEQLDSYDQRPRFDVEGVQRADIAPDTIDALIEKVVCTPKQKEP